MVDRFRKAPLWIKLVATVVAGLLLINIVDAIFGHEATHRNPATASNAGDAMAKAQINEALGTIAGWYEVSHNYLFTTAGLTYTNRALRHVSSLAASTHGQAFQVSIGSSSGTTYEVKGAGTRLTRTCRPAGPACPDGHWKGSSVLVVPKPPRLTAGQKSAVRSILLSSVRHYEAELAAGREALGSTQYASPYAAIAALKEPNSAASKFSKFHQQTNPEDDLSYTVAFKRADRIFTAANEPEAMEAWRNAMERAWSAFIPWVNDATSWQIGSVSTSKLQADEVAIEGRLAQARADALRAAR